jgi:hypothetical protein
LASGTFGSLPTFAADVSLERQLSSACPILFASAANGSFPPMMSTMPQVQARIAHTQKNS